MMSVKISLNGETITTAAATVRALLDEQSIDAEARGVAVALNGAVVPRSAWSDTALTEGDTAEIVKPFRGG